MTVMTLMAKVLIDIEGLPEMPIQGLRIGDVIGAGTLSMTANDTDGLNCTIGQLNPESEPAFKH